MKYPIDLGREHPVGNLSAIPMPEPPEKHYPGTHFEWGEDYEMPEEGTITLRYRVTREVVEKVPKEKNCVDVDFLEILDVKPSKGVRDDRAEASETLDKLRDEAGDY